MKALLEGNTELTDQVYETERYVNFLDREITDTLVKVNQMELPIQDAKEIGGLFHVEDVLTLGDKVTVVCLGKDKMGRLSFSIKDVPKYSK